MALLKCPDCNKDMSDKAAACPSCGCPVDAIIFGYNPTIGMTEAKVTSAKLILFNNVN